MEVLLIGGAVFFILVLILSKVSGDKEDPWYKRISFADWFWIVFIIGAIVAVKVFN